MNRTREVLRRRRLYLALIVLAALVAALPAPRPSPEVMRDAVTSLRGIADSVIRHAAHPPGP